MKHRITRSQPIRRPTKRDAFQALKSAYDSHNLVLALGAGVSKGCGLPDWNQLVRALAHKHLKAPRPPYERLAEYLEHSPLRIAEVVRDQFSSRAAFANAIRRELYATGPFRRFFDKPFWDIMDDFVEFVAGSNSTLHAVASLCAEDASQGRFSQPNPAIRAVINFNFDALFRIYVEGRFGSSILRTVERAAIESDPARISVYHVHGYLQFLADSMSSQFESADLITFSETDYFDVFDQSGAIFNYTTRYLLRERSVLFIGLSMKDINLRRILHYSISELRRSYREVAHRPATRTQLLCHFAILSTHKLDPAVQHYAERDLARFGVRPIWIKDFTALPELLERLRR